MSKLVFIYNAESGLANALLDTGRKMFKPEEYDCALCMITYGPFGMKTDWKKFVKSLPYEVSFLHKDELSEKMQNMNLDLPCLVLNEDEEIEVLINGEKFRQIKDLAELKAAVTKGLSAHAPAAL